MTGEPARKGASRTFSDEELAWIREHMTELQRSVTGQQVLQLSLGIAFVVGLVVHVVGYMLKSSSPTGLLGLVADLLYALGWALWTGVVVVVFVQIIPEVKRRQIKRALDEYEAELRNKTGA